MLACVNRSVSYNPHETGKSKLEQWALPNEPANCYSNEITYRF